MNYKIKKIEEKDIVPFYPLLAEIEVGSLFNPDNESHLKWLKNRITVRYGSGTEFFAMYSTENEIIGIAGVQTEETLDGIEYLGRKSELMDIVIAEEYRGKGYGSKLLKYCEDYAKEKGAYCFYAATSAFDYKAITFYGKNGLVPIATLSDINGPNEDGALYMRKVLK